MKKTSNLPKMVRTIRGAKNGFDEKQTNAHALLLAWRVLLERRKLQKKQVEEITQV